MDAFSIAQLSQYSGIKPHTIRIWEKRYNALQPNRSDGNTRYYNSEQLRRLLNIVSLLDAGYKASEACSLSDKKLFARVEAIQQSVPIESSDYFVAQLAAAGIDYDEAHFANIFSHCLLRYGIKDCYLKVIYPLLVRLGLMWASDRIISAPEHFISNILRQKLFTAVDALPPPAEGAEKWMLFLPEDEFHEIGLLFAKYLVCSAGKKVFYLGANVPLPSLIDVVKETQS
ncbi:MAG TPA: MerR family transcriptional regulator, partial [Agriterribacter sp.]|nr:MerR family transcriptional regulator [Agriterribacter sp.]